MIISIVIQRKISENLLRHLFTSHLRCRAASVKVAFLPLRTLRGGDSDRAPSNLSNQVARSLLKHILQLDFATSFTKTKLLTRSIVSDGDVVEGKCFSVKVVQRVRLVRDGMGARAHRFPATRRVVSTCCDLRHELPLANRHQFVHSPLAPAEFFFSSGW